MGTIKFSETFNIDYHYSGDEGCTVTVEPAVVKGSVHTEPVTLTIKSKDFFTYADYRYKKSQYQIDRQVFYRGAKISEYKLTLTPPDGDKELFIAGLTFIMKFNPDKGGKKFTCTKNFSMTTNTEAYTVTPQLAPEYSQDLPIDIVVKLKDNRDEIVNPRMFISSDSFTGFKSLDKISSTEARIHFDDSEEITCQQLNFSVTRPKQLITTLNFSVNSHQTGYTLTPELGRAKRYNLPLTLTVTGAKPLSTVTAEVEINNVKKTLNFTVDEKGSKAELYLSDTDDIYISDINIEYTAEKYKLTLSDDFKVNLPPELYSVEPAMTAGATFDLPVKFILHTQDEFKSAYLNIVYADGSTFQFPFTAGDWSGDSDKHLANAYIQYNGNITANELNITVKDIDEKPAVANVYRATAEVISAVNDTVTMGNRYNKDKHISSYLFRRCYGNLRFSPDLHDVYINGTNLNVKSNTTPSRYTIDHTITTNLTYEDYTDLEPYTKISLEVPFVGMVELLNTSPIDEVHLQYNVDIVASASNCTITTPNERLILPCKPYYDLSFSKGSVNMDKILYDTLTVNGLNITLHKLKPRIISKSDLVPVTYSNINLSDVLSKPNVKFKATNLRLSSINMRLEELHRLERKLMVGVITKEK